MIQVKRNARHAGFLATLFSATALMLAVAAPASAAPVLQVHAASNPTAAPGSQIQYLMQLNNVGDVGTPIGTSYRVKASLPSGLTGVSGVSGNGWTCAVLPASIECTNSASNASRTIRITDQPQFIFTVAVAPDASGTLMTAFELYGGGAVLPGGAACASTVEPPPALPPCATTVDATVITPNAPQFGVAEFDGRVTADSSGNPLTQAAGHPYDASAAVEFHSINNPDFVVAPGSASGQIWPVEPTKDVVVDLPPGLLGNPTVVDQCSAAELAYPGGLEVQPLCPVTSQVGATSIRVNGVAGGNTVYRVPVFNLIPPPGVPARFGFNVSGTIVTLDAELRTGSDYGVSIKVSNISQGLAVQASSVTFWGVPSDPSHDADRTCPGFGYPEADGINATAPQCVDDEGNPLYVRPPAKALLRNPTSCAGPVDTTVHADSWPNPGKFDSNGRPDLSDPEWDSAGFVSHNPPGYPLAPQDWGPPQGTTGCAQAPFTPTISLEPTSSQADSPTGLEVDLSIPQGALSDPDAIAQSDLKKAVVTLPRGMTVNPSSADGLGACSQAQIALKSEANPTCPDSSKLGTLEIETPLLDHPVPGTVYLAKQGDNPFGSLLAMYLVAKDPESGVVIKLAGRVDGDSNGTLTTTFDNQPQLPFSSLHLELKDGPRAPLINPPACGSHSSSSTFTGWSGAVAQTSSSFLVTSGPNGAPCGALGGGPTISAGLQSQLAGTRSPFVFKLKRADGAQQFSSLELDTPPGLSAVLAGVPYCPDAIASTSGACPEASRLGSASVGAGAGPNTYYLDGGRVYLAGPYQGAPISIVTVIRAVAGPFDLGDVVVRSALFVDPTDAHVHVVTDLPDAIQGIAPHIRNLYIALDRPNFMNGPTSCDPMATSAVVHGPTGSATASDRFQMLLCGALEFQPRLSLRLKGSTKRAGNPKLIATLDAREGDANIGRAQVTLPRSAFLDQSHIRTVCTRVQFAADACPRGSIYGKASATSPLLDYTLAGPVYLRSSNNTLPDLVAALKGPGHQPIEIELAGRTDSIRGALRNTFDVVPDAPVSTFRLELFGGKRGLIDNSRNLCAKTYRANVLLDGQNGKTHDFKPVVKADCGKGRKGKR